MERVRLAPAVAGRIGTSGVSLLDISVMGAGVEHHEPLITGSHVHLSFRWNGEEVEADCRIVRSRLERLANGSDGTVYHSGVEFKPLAPDIRGRLKRIVAHFITLSLQEQKLNARGAMPVNEERMPVFCPLGQLTGEEASDSEPAAVSATPRKRRYVRCELEGTRWRWKRTEEASQPADGFTICESEEDQQIQLLCDAYARSEPHNRLMIQTLAQLSLTGDQDKLDAFNASGGHAAPLPFVSRQM